jgi:hypothetical protein
MVQIHGLTELQGQLLVFGQVAVLLMTLAAGAQLLAVLLVAEMVVFLEIMMLLMLAAAVAQVDILVTEEMVRGHLQTLLVTVLEVLVAVDHDQHLQLAVGAVSGFIPAFLEQAEKPLLITA